MAPSHDPPILPFEFVGGHVALDFANTVSWGIDTRSEERLASYDQLLKWVAEARLPLDVNALSARANADSGAAARALTEALALRSDLHELFLARARGGALTKGLLATLNGRVADALARMELQETHDTGRTRLAWRLRNASALDAPVHWLVWEAARLVAMNERIKRCANPSCGWVFLDHSRRGNRRWCDMAVCGSRHKARTYYRRQRRRARQAASR
jgi:predicted RNA-binding Zn ribbon-like protein